MEEGKTIHKLRGLGKKADSLRQVKSKLMVGYEDRCYVIWQRGMCWKKNGSEKKMVEGTFRQRSCVCPKELLKKKELKC